MLEGAPLQLEIQKVEELEHEFSVYLSELIAKRLDNIREYGKKMSIGALVSSLMKSFGEQFYDCFLSLIQQYSIADVEVLSASGRGKFTTGFNLALFGPPGTGKTFATCDFILGNEKEDIPPFGLPGRNRYCGGMTPAMFIRIGQAYEGRKFNFVIPEFNDFFKYRGMVEPLKLALERKSVSYETAHEVIKPYKFDCLLSVNYNTSVFEQGYETTISDPNFSAIEDRMICRLHRLTKERFLRITDTMFDFLTEHVDLRSLARPIRDHLTLVYAAQTKHPLVSEILPIKPVLLTDEAMEIIKSSVKIFLEYLPGGTVSFSPRIVKKTLQLASTMTLLKYFQYADSLPIDKDSLKWAIRIFCEEASVRSQEKVSPEEVFREIVFRCGLPQN